MSTLSRESAREIIDAIREENGGISQADRERTPLAVLKALDSVRAKLGASTRTLATNIYSKDTRFVFELIQNAEDNLYTRALKANKGAYIEFIVRPDSVTVDSNEDGFTEEDVRSICSIGQSKKTSSGYIGEKGIGFKSVFKIASQVRIQSEPFSFSFDHERGDNGLGMVTPANRDHEDLPGDVHTRIKLRLAEPARFAQRVADFLELPDTLLLFLKKLSTITIGICRPNQPLFKIVYSYDEEEGSPIVKLTKALGPDEDRQEAVNLYHVAKRSLRNLPEDEARKQTDKAEVVLAFPVDGNFAPVIQQQHVFAYLPLRRVGFSFLIQSDFITQANREDVVRSPRNEAILEGVAETFRDGVLEFCEHPSLQYEWLKYLPSKSISDEFWAQLRPKILTLLKRTKVLRTRGQGVLKQPQDLRYLPMDCLDRSNKPLFDDLTEEMYLSSKYKGIEHLRELGVRNINYDEILDRIQADAGRSDSKMIAIASDVDWHTRVAKLLLKAFEEGSPHIRQRLRGLQIIPLLDGRTISSSEGSILYPDSGGVPIPTDLNLKLVKSEAIQNQFRSQLFSKLGVDRCHPERIVDLIRERYYGSNDVRLEDSVAHVRYLYWHLPKGVASLNDSIYLLDHHKIPVRRQIVPFARRDVCVDDLYFESDDEYGIQRLLSSNGTMPEISVHFINPAYLKAVPNNARSNDRSWETWLEEVAQVRRIPRLVEQFEPSKLSKIFLHIAKRRAEKLVGTLQAHWSSYSSLMLPKIVDALANTHVPCENTQMMRLNGTYLPLPNLKDECKRFSLEGQLPFIQLPTQLTEGSDQRWRFLEMFQVGMVADIRFYLYVLQHCVRLNPAAEYRKGVFDVYKAVKEHSRVADHECIRGVFKQEKLIFVPSKGSRAANWALPKDCVWDAPAFLRVKYPLASVKEYRDDVVLTRLFYNTLLIPDASHMDYIHELERIRSSDCVNPSEVVEIYHKLWQMKDDRRAWEDISEYFRVSLLIYVLPQKTWHSKSSCLWTEAARISGKVAIADQYAELKEFFHGLGVRAPSVDMFVAELKALAHGERNPTIEEVKHFIVEINHREPRKGALEELKPLNVLPIKPINGQVCLRNSHHPFAIVDRLEYGKAFEGKYPILDFSLEDVHKLQPFLSALELQDRYMSRIVEEKSTVEGGAWDRDLSDKFRQKAYALFRCAFHYQSHKARDDDRSLYEILLATDVYLSNGFSKTLILSQGDRRITVESAKGNLHIEEGRKHLKLYIPRESTARERCYLSQLPQRLLQYLAIPDAAAKSTLTAILTGSQAVLNDILEYDGIVEVPGLVPLQSTVLHEEDLEYQTVESDTATSSSAGQQRATPPSEINGSPAPTPLRPTTISPNQLTRESTLSSNRSNSAFTFTYNLPHRTSFLAPPLTPTPSSGPSLSPPAQETAPRIFDSTEEYRTLLDRIITAASQAKFPSRSLFDPNSLLHADGSNPLASRRRTSLSSTVFGDRSQNQISHDMKVGAAGELFVFEMLLRLGLPAFTRGNWKSTIRKEVRIHRKYSDMEPWNGAETADLTYDDAEGDFTRLLIEKGYLPSATWEQARPKYYLEVKTTTKECNTRFFVSGSQYQRMQRVALTEGQAAPEVYIILRVYNLGQEDIGLHIYLDPETRRRKNELKFTAESYSVEPTGRAGI